MVNPYQAESAVNNLEGTIEAPEGELHLRFYISSGEEFALPAIGIREVLEYPPDRINPVPNVSPLILGTINVRGRVLWVGDLGQFLGAPPFNVMSDVSIIAAEHQGTVLGLAIERIGSMAWLSPQKLVPARSVPDRMAPFVKGEWLLEDGSSLKLLDQVNIINAPLWAA